MRLHLRSPLPLLLYLFLITPTPSTASNAAAETTAHDILTAAFPTTATTTTTTNSYHPFQPACSATPLAPSTLPSTSPPHATHAALLLHKRANSNCGTHFSSCASIGFPQLCCTTTAVCSADYAGNVACCPIGAACTGNVNGGNGGGQTQTLVYVSTTTQQQQITGVGVGAGVTTTAAGFVEAGGTTVAVLSGGAGRTGTGGWLGVVGVVEGWLVGGWRGK